MPLSPRLRKLFIPLPTDSLIQIDPNDMKRLCFLLLVASCFVLSGCENPAKSRSALNEGLQMFYDQADNVKAAECFQKAIRYDKSNYEAYHLLGCTQFNRGLYDEAILNFEKTLELRPGFYDAEFALGRIYYMRQDYDMACFYYKAAEQHGRDNMEDYVRTCQ